MRHNRMVQPSLQGFMASTANTEETSSRLEPPLDVPTVWNMRGELLQMTRPSNLPGVVLFHMLGVYLAVGGTVASSTTALVGRRFHQLYWSILLKEPLVWLSLVSIALVSASSMVVNDYYDAKLGRDALKADRDQRFLLRDVTTDHETESTTVSQSKQVVRQFLMYLYAAALLLSNILPGMPTRLSVTIGLMMTYLYTVHLKPMTWVKNIVCASLIALAPWTSGSCALYVLQQYGLLISATGVWRLPSLWRLLGVLFLGVWGRELLMDCNDITADAASGIQTVPLVHGTAFAATVATVTTVVMTVLATLPHVNALLASNGPVSWTSLRRLVLASLGSAIQLVGTLRVRRTQGLDGTVIDTVVGQSLWTVVLLLASFV